MNILLCSDNLMTRAQLEGTWRNAGAMVYSSAETEPDLIVIDLTANTALERVEALRNEYPKSEILVFGPHVDGDAFKQARTAGASSQVARGKVVERVLKYIQAKDPLS